MKWRLAGLVLVGVKDAPSLTFIGGNITCYDAGGQRGNGSE